ncbi:hypothetical protein [Paenibacillus polymyxa]|uniref:hypothetical protein n=1 Tax=Paenibacillus polymyxa TaxID=1406 RepID=UPI002378E3E6|nr:hypothetical protein [Paenibacillus polymyxa]WDM20584.1 hypothetical protein J4I02_16255 [Paenibacillus polymyxa]
MLKKTYEFFLFYNKIILREGLGNYLWSLVMPLLIFFSINVNWFFEKPSLGEAIHFFSVIWSYNIISMYLYGFAGRISIFRESGFLRSFTYVVGNKKPIIMSLFFIQLFHGFISIFSFTLVATLMFDIPTAMFVSIAILTFTLVSIPVSMLMLFLVFLPINTSTLNSIGSIVMLPALFMSMFKQTFKNQILNSAFFISPVEYVSQASKSISDLLLYGHLSKNIPTLLIISTSYVVVGLLVWKYIKINAKIVRT